MMYRRQGKWYWTRSAPCMTQHFIMDSRFPQMLAFKKADLDIQRKSLSAYTRAPTHSLKSITASTMRFLDRNMSRTPPPTELADTVTSACSPLYTSVGEHDMIQDGLKHELDSYLHEPRMAPFKKIAQDSESDGHRLVVVWCDPLQYWMVFIVPWSTLQFS
jgi:hypothetical protein